MEEGAVDDEPEVVGVRQDVEQQHVDYLLPGRAPTSACFSSGELTEAVPSCWLCACG